MTGYTNPNFMFQQFYELDLNYGSVIPIRYKSLIVANAQLERFKEAFPNAFITKVVIERQKLNDAFIRKTLAQIERLSGHGGASWSEVDYNTKTANHE